MMIEENIDVIMRYFEVPDKICFITHFFIR